MQTKTKPTAAQARPKSEIGREPLRTKSLLEGGIKTKPKKHPKRISRSAAIKDAIAVEAAAWDALIASPEYLAFERHRARGWEEKAAACRKELEAFEERKNEAIDCRDDIERLRSSLAEGERYEHYFGLALARAGEIIGKETNVSDAAFAGLKPIIEATPPCTPKNILKGVERGQKLREAIYRSQAHADHQLALENVERARLGKKPKEPDVPIDTDEPPEMAAASPVPIDPGVPPF